jgi:hypothetical protein
MNLRRAVQCGALTCMITLAVPSIAHADNNLGPHSQPTHCIRPSQSESTATQLSSTGNDLLAPRETDRGHDSRDNGYGYNRYDWFWYWFWYWYWHWYRDHCVPDPPADVPEAPQVLMLSGSAVLTGGAAMLIIRRRSRNAAPAGA